MRTTFSYNGLEISMSSRNTGAVANVFGDKGMRYKYNVTVKTANGQTSFTFYDSIHNYNIGISELDQDSLKNALSCFLSDGMSYDYSYNFIEFCQELGYDSDSRRAMNVYNACKRHHLAAVRVFGSEYAEIYNQINEE